MKQTRRKVLQGFAASTAAAVSAPTIIKAERTFKWRLVMAIPKTLPVWGTAVQNFAEQIETMSNGQLTIRVYGAGELVPPLEVFNSVKAGQVQMAHSASYYWQGMMPAAPFFTSVPFGLNANGMRSWIKYGGGYELWKELYQPHNIMPLIAGNTGLQMGGWFNKEIRSMEDFKGLKMRIPGLGGKVLQKAGGKPMLVAGGEIFTNLSTGVIDATEWVGPLHDFTMGFHKAAKFYYHPGWHEPGPALELLINKSEWAKLPNHLQEIVKVAADALDANIYSEWIAKDAEYLQRIKKMESVQIKKFPSTVLQKLKRLASEVKAEVAATSPLATKIYKSYEKFHKVYMEHYSVTEGDYFSAQVEKT